MLILNSKPIAKEGVVLLIKKYREQHKALLEVATAINEQLDAEKLAVDAEDVRLNLSRLLGQLTVHLAMEDNALYPELLNKDDPVVYDTARRFMDEMGGISDEVKIFIQKWPSAAAIQGASKEFVSDASYLLTILSERIDLEDRELFPLVENS